MDIVMHATIGAVVATPFLETHPLAAGAFMFGSVAPDLDSMSRMAGKRAFLKCHQTYLHSIPVIVAGAAVTSAGLKIAGVGGVALPWLFAAGMIVHVLLDLTNTYGVKLMAPFDRRRRHLDSIFFIDLPLWVLTVTVVGILLINRSPWVVGVYVSTYLAYVLAKILLRQRVNRFLDGNAVCVEPSAWFPWSFRVTLPAAEGLTQTRVNAVTGQVMESETFDHRGDFQDVLEQSDNYRLMRELSPAYALTDVEVDGPETRLLCRDLHHRNFSTKFGNLEIVTDGTKIVKEVFHV